MSVIVGIDTGGTYTDGVIFDLAGQKVISKTKVLTTHEDLAIGIRQCLNDLDLESFTDIKMVSLSTTLATNAIVEGRGAEVGLILIGEKPIDRLPVHHYVVIAGGHDIKGNEKEELDLEAAKEATREFIGKVSAVAVSGFASVRNPEHELRVKKLVKETLKVPVVCGHQLTTSLGFYERSVTAAVNAKLIPIIATLINSVKEVLRENGIHAKLMIAKGDGTLMSEEMALEKPVETILSGPAASITGATTLTEIMDGLVLDIGGTTSDIALLQQGVPRLNLEGAAVGGWLTRVKAADINTFGIGGDSYLRVDKQAQLQIGPQKVWPLSVLGQKYPYLYEELETLEKHLNHVKPAKATDCYMLVKENEKIRLHPDEERIIELLKSGAHTLYFIANTINKSPFSLDLEHLVDRGLLAKGALTPTDLLHVEGKFTRWNREIAGLGVHILATLTGQSREQFMKNAMEGITNKLVLAVLESMLVMDGAPKELVKNLESNYLINKIINPSDKDRYSTVFRLKVPIIGIGAPADLFLPSVAQKLKTELVIPKDYDVANAVGAAAGNVMETVSVLIEQSLDGYLLYSQLGRKVFSDLEEAKEYGLEQAKTLAMKMAEISGAADYQVFEKCEDKYSKGYTGTYLETNIEVTIVGRPSW